LDRILGMKRLVLILLLGGCASPEPAPRPAPAPAPRTSAPGVPTAITAEGVPAIPEEITKRLAQYQSSRGATFEDWGPSGSLLISTRFSDTAQLHLVPFPGGRREQLTFSDEPISIGLSIPGTGDLIYTQSQGGNENWQIYRLD